MRIVSRSGPYIAAMPLAVSPFRCRMCDENDEVGNDAIRAVHEGRGAEAFGIAEEWARQIEGHSCEKWRNATFMAPRRGRWLSVRLEVGVYDPVLRADYRLPIARADVLAEGGEADCPDRFRVVSTPGAENEGRIAQWFLGHLDADERRALLSDMKEV